MHTCNFRVFHLSKNNHYRSIFHPEFFFHNDLSQTNGKMSFRTGEFLQGNVWLGGGLAPTPLASPAPAPQTTDYYLKIFGSR